MSRQTHFGTEAADVVHVFAGCGTLAGSLISAGTRPLSFDV